MNSRLQTGLIISLIGVFLILAGVFAAVRLLNLTIVPASAQPTPQPETRLMVVVASHDIPSGRVLSQDDIVLEEIPLQYVPRDTISAFDLAVGKITKTDLFQGEMILSHNLANPTGQIYDIAYVLDDTHVLMAIPATDLMSREALIKRGDIIDVLATLSIPAEPSIGEQDLEDGDDLTPKLVTFGAFQRLNITAIVIDIIQNEDVDAPIDGFPEREQVVLQAYLIALDPQDALVLKFIKDNGGIFDFVLRAPTSTGEFELTPVTAEFIKELYGLELIP